MFYYEVVGHKETRISSEVLDRVFTKIVSGVQSAARSTYIVTGEHLFCLAVYAVRR